MPYKITELATGAILLLGSLIAWLNLRHLPDDAKMFPNMVLFVMGIATIGLIIRSFTGASQRIQGEQVRDWKFSIHPLRMIGGLALFAIYLLVVETLGYFTTSALFIVIVAAFAQYRHWPALIGSAIGFCIFVYAVFGLLFDRPLPEEFFLSNAVIELHDGVSAHA